MESSTKTEIYKKLPLKKLIAFCIWKVEEKNEECTFERLVKECFENFPKSFSFYRYPHWPDSLKLDRPIRELRSPDKYITGSNETRFLLTDKGLEFAKAVAHELESPILEKKSETGGRKEEKLLREIKSSNEFEEFIKSEGKSVLTESSIRDLAHATLETPHEIVVERLRNLERLATNAEDMKLSNFIRRCKELITNG